MKDALDEMLRLFDTDSCILDCDYVNDEKLVQLMQDLDGEYQGKAEDCTSLGIVETRLYFTYNKRPFILRYLSGVGSCFQLVDPAAADVPEEWNMKFKEEWAIPLG